MNKPLQIGDLTAPIPVIQGGMGVGISLSGLAGAVAKAGGIGIISNCITLAAPKRIAVPTQSFPVSPPPITMTFLSFAEIAFPSEKLESSRLFVTDDKYCTAK